jgi:hypothetical protein
MPRPAPPLSIRVRDYLATIDKSRNVMALRNALLIVSKPALFLLADRRWALTKRVSVLPLLVALFPVRLQVVFVIGVCVIFDKADVLDNIKSFFKNIWVSLSPIFGYIVLLRSQLCFPLRPNPCCDVC